MAIINRKKDGTRYDRSSLERTFETIWKRDFPDLDLVVEQTLVPGRRFRCDYVELKSGVVIEIHGSQFSRHSSHKGKGAASDAEKQNSLVRLGYTPYILWTAQVIRPEIIILGEFIKSKIDHQ